MHGMGLLPCHHAPFFGAPLMFNLLDINLLIGDGFVCPTTMAETIRCDERTVTFQVQELIETRRGHRDMSSGGGGRIETSHNRVPAETAMSGLA